MLDRSDLLQRVTIHPDLCGGRPCIRGMRIRVSDLVEMVAEGTSFDQILSEFTYLERADLAAALHYSARAVDHRVIQAA